MKNDYDLEYEIMLYRIIYLVILKIKKIKELHLEVEKLRSDFITKKKLKLSIKNDID